MKKLLIISPHFPPINGADMHRIRQSLPYYPEFGWEPTVVCVHPDYVEAAQDSLLLKSIPQHLRIISLRAFSPKLTRKVGLGSLALRSIWFYWRTVNQLLSKEKYDLIFFSTTQFPVLILGNYWKRRFGVPFVIDMQDPWHSNYYLDKPKAERPPKFWFSYNLNKYLEPIAMRRVAALIAVSNAYNQTLCGRYPHLKPSNCYTIPFGAFEKDMEIAQLAQQLDLAIPQGGKSIVYIGRGGFDMHRALRIIFSAFRIALTQRPQQFSLFRFYFIGTSYAPSGKGKPTILPIAAEFDLQDYVEEQTDRVPYFQALRTLQEADFLLIPGSDDPQYTASKIYPYLLAKRPTLAVFHEKSSAGEILETLNSGIALQFGENEPDEKLAEVFAVQWMNSLDNGFKLNQVDRTALTPYLASTKTREQVEVFNKVLGENHLFVPQKGVSS